MLVTISGPDGAGKTTQIKKLLTLYKQSGLTVASVNDGMESFGYTVGTDLHQ